MIRKKKINCEMIRKKLEKLKIETFGIRTQTYVLN